MKDFEIDISKLICKIFVWIDKNNTPILITYN